MVNLEAKVGKILLLVDALLERLLVLGREGEVILHHLEATVTLLDVGVDLGKLLAPFGDHFHQQGARVDAVLARNVSLDGQTSRGLTADHSAGLSHLGRHPLETDRNLVARLPVGLGNAIEQVRRREVAHAPALPALVLQQVRVQQDQDLVGVEEMSLIIDDTESVSVTIGGDADVGSPLDDLLGQRLQGLGVRGRETPAKEGVAALVNGIDVATSRHEDGLEAGARDSEHRVEDNLEVGVSNRFEVDMVEDRVDVPVHRGLHLDQPVTKGVSAVYALDVGWADGIGTTLDGFSNLHLGVTTALREHLESVVRRGVVGGRDRHAIGTVQVADSPHDHRGRSRPVNDPNGEPISREHFCRPPCEFWGEEALVVPNDNRALLLVLVMYTV